MRRSNRFSNQRSSNGPKSRKVWGYWDCPKCETKKIIGKEKDCPNCGAGAPGPNAFYLDTSQGRDENGRFKGLQEVVEPEFKDKVGKAPDWICPSCETGNWTHDLGCRMCSTPKPGSPADNDSAVPHREGRRGSLPPLGPPSPAVGDRFSSSDDFDDEMKKVGFIASIGGITGLAAISVGILLLVGLFVWGFRTHSVEGVVTSMTWSHTTTLHEWTSVRDGDWCDSISERSEIRPVNGRGERAGIRVTDRDYRYRRTVQEACGTETVSVTRTRREACGAHESCSSSGDGSFHCHMVTDYCSVPYQDTETRTKYCDRRISDWYCDYETQRWAQKDRKNASGSGRETRWLHYTLSPLQKETFSGEYRVNFSYGTETTYLSPSSENEYLTWAVGQPAQIFESNLFGVRDVKHFDPRLPVESVSP